jgi:hypothetical protein
MHSAEMVKWLVDWSAASMRLQETTLLNEGHPAANTLFGRDLEDAEKHFLQQFGSNPTIRADELADIRKGVIQILNRLFDDVRAHRR